MSANDGYAASYGADDLMTAVKGSLSRVFETDVEVWLCASGTAANALALSVLCSPLESIICHEEAHINCDERGAPEFFSGGARLDTLTGEHGRISLPALSDRLETVDRNFVHATPPGALSLTNLTEAGAIYTPGDIGALCGLAKGQGLQTHMDGARFANAISGSGYSAADMTWRAGVDVLTLGATKNGALGCEAIVLFGRAREKHDELLARSKRAGQMPPKMRFLAAQMLAWLDGDLWLKLADDANRAADQLAGILRGRGAELVHPVDGNEVFVRLPQEVRQKLEKHDAKFHNWPNGASRFVCSWCTSDEDLKAVVRALA